MKTQDWKTVKEPEKAERESKGLADMRGDPRRLVRVEPHGESGAQNAPAVHRKGRNHVEQREKQIRRGELLDEAERWVLDVLQRLAPEGAGDGQQYGGDHDIDEGTGDRDQQFLVGPLRHLVEIGDAADREQRHLRRMDAIAPRRQYVPELMQHDAGEDGDDEEDALLRRLEPAAHIGRDADPGEEDQKGHMDAHIGAEEASNGDRPAHDEAAFPSADAESRPSFSLRDHPQGAQQRRRAGDASQAQ